MVERLQGSQLSNLGISEEGEQIEQENTIEPFQGIDFPAQFPSARTSTPIPHVDLGETVTDRSQALRSLTHPGRLCQNCCLLGDT